MMILKVNCQPLNNDLVVCNIIYHYLKIINFIHVRFYITYNDKMFWSNTLRMNC